MVMLSKDADSLNYPHINTGYCKSIGTNPTVCRYLDRPSKEYCLNDDTPIFITKLNRMNYQIIRNESTVKTFIDWLPDLKEHEMYMVQLYARNKYVENPLLALKSTIPALGSIVCKKEKMFKKIKQLECEIGSYRHGGTDIPQEALVLYIDLNPKNLEVATKKALIKLVNLVTKPYNNYNPLGEVTSAISKSKSSRRYVDFDVDCDKEEVSIHNIIEAIDTDKVPISAIRFLETRGGYHMVVDTKLIGTIYKYVWYLELSRVQKLFSTHGSNPGSDKIPFPGCTQGNFIPYFIPII